MVDAYLEQGGLGSLVRRHPGLRIPGAFDGFELAFRTLLRSPARPGSCGGALAQRVGCALGEAFDSGIPGLTRLAPGPERVAEAGGARLASLGLSARRADAVASVARAVADGTLRLEPGRDVLATRRALMEIAGIGDRLATTIVMRALYWPDAFPASDRVLQRAAGTAGPRALRARAEQWRPWRAYAALHLWLHAERPDAAA